MLIFGSFHPSKIKNMNSEQLVQIQLHSLGVNVSKNKPYDGKLGV